MKILYLDCSHSGISGDMFLASLLGMLKNPKTIMESLERLKDYLGDVKTLDISLLTVERSGMRVNQLKIEIHEVKTHRTPKILQEALDAFLDDNDYSNPAKLYARNVLNSLFQAEANVHGKLIENIHLHELSSVDTLIDILGVTKALDLLGYFHKDVKIYCSVIPLGGGEIKTAHGLLTVPAPATVKILENSDLLIQNGPVKGELVTPTGAALLINLNVLYKPFFQNLKLEKVSYATGQKIFNKFSNILRIFYGEVIQESKLLDNSIFEKYIEDVFVLETDVDDTSGEILGNFIQEMEKSKILDIQVISSITKKNRPGYLIKLLCHPQIIDEVLTKMFSELGTLGVRISKIKRVCIEREIEPVSVVINQQEFEINYKLSYVLKGNKKHIINIKPEYEDLKKISDKTGLTVKEVKLKTASEITNLFEKKFD
jgi:uncharacterized protein (TIGR00299 family) protein